MRTRAQVMGHPLHPMLVMFPLALIPLALVFDIVYLVRQEALWWTISFWMLLSGVVGGVVATIPGLIDYTTIGRDHPARRVATQHMVSGFALLALAAVSLFLRDFGQAPPSVNPWIPVVLLIGANAVAGLQGYWGGELVYRHAVGVNPRVAGEEQTPAPGQRAGPGTGFRPGGGMT
ncbi:MAG TPA: DUF2231 domain-containing protein [Candidatus Thermoplasmatota archaeon]|nr:DUF2231 domain-containing protein [Candidatus Thermoplasmatota archaeon]